MPEPPFTKDERVWALIDGKRVRAIYDENNADGFHYVFLVDASSPHKWGKLVRLTLSEITERYI